MRHAEGSLGTEVPIQHCPYPDCAHRLALPIPGHYVCGYCSRLICCRFPDRLSEEIRCYQVRIRVARDLGPVKVPA